MLSRKFDSSIIFRAELRTLCAYSMYTWSPHCPKNTYGIPCGPMLWGDRQVSDFENTVHSPIAGGDLLYGFNEYVILPSFFCIVHLSHVRRPNQAGQSNMNPQHGCDLWHQHIQPKAAQGFKLITPATSSAPNGLTWVKDFMKCCSDCTVCIRLVALANFLTISFSVPRCRCPLV